MGRLMGKRPDRTVAIGRAVRRHLRAGEEVLAGVQVQAPGTLGAGLAGGASGAVGAAVGTLPPRLGEAGPKHARWVEQAGAVGVDADRAGRAVWMYLVLTSARLLLVRRSRLTGRAREVLVAWPLADVERVGMARGGASLDLEAGGQRLRLEVPVAPKFLPAVYRELPERLARARRQAG